VHWRLRRAAELAHLTHAKSSCSDLESSQPVHDGVPPLLNVKSGSVQTALELATTFPSNQETRQSVAWVWWYSSCNIRLQLLRYGVRILHQNG
jgi:hypothetical protein